MKLVGTGKNVLDVDLLGRLGVQQTSGKTISQKEVKSTIAQVKNELADEFVSSARGLARAEKAIANTLNLAIKSGWVRNARAADMMREFVKGSDDKSLAGVVEELRDEIRANRSTGRRGYGSYSRGTSSYGSRTTTRTTGGYGSRTTTRTTGGYGSRTSTSVGT